MCSTAVAVAAGSNVWTRQQKVIFVGRICPSHLQDASDHVCSVFISTFFSDNLIIYETPNLIKFYTCLVWELTFYS